LQLKQYQWRGPTRQGRAAAGGRVQTKQGDKPKFFLTLSLDFGKSSTVTAEAEVELTKAKK
jgi:hypothetical protein